MQVTAEALRTRIKYLKDVAEYRYRAQYYGSGVGLDATERFELAAYEMLLSRLEGESKC